MIVLLLVTSVLFALGAWSVVRLSTRALHRLGIDPAGAALWLGLAEFPPEEAPAPRARPRPPAPARRRRVAMSRPRLWAGAPRRRAPVPRPRASVAPPAPHRRPVVEWGEGADFAFATQASVGARH